MESQPNSNTHHYALSIGQHPMRPLRIHSLSISPDPVTLPGIATVSFDVESKSAISNMDLAVTIKKKTFIGDFVIPCFGYFGSW